MLKTLITTCLLTFSCASGSLSQEKDLNVRKSYNSNNLQGCWCLHDHFGSTIPSNNGEFVYYDYTFYANDVEAPRVLYRAQDDSSINYITAREITITTDNGQSCLLHCNLGEESIYERIYTGDDLSELYLDTQNCIVWFPSGYYVSNDDFKVWTYLFQREENSTCTYYNGWYSFTSFENTKFQVMGPMIVNNNLYSAFFYQNGEGYAELYGLNSTSYTLIDNYQIEGSSQILFNGVLINDGFYQEMLDCGVFDYVYQPVQYTFGDMIFSVIDAPIYMLSQLFSFQLFDIQFYVAFMGVATVLLIFFIVRKVV